MHSDPQPVILIGAARSGTKILRDMVASHADVDKVPYDINYVWRLGSEHIAHDELTPADLSAAASERIRRQLDAFSAGAPILIEKTVSNCLRVPYVDAIVPDARYIHLIRDGRDVVESAYRQWTASPDWRYILRKACSYPIGEAPGYAVSYARSTLQRVLSHTTRPPAVWGPRYRGIERDLETRELVEVCALQWNHSVTRALNDLQHVKPERMLVVRYEEFVVDPRGHLLKLAEFLDIDPAGFDESTLSSISRDNIGKGLRTLSIADANKVLAIIGPALEALHYPSTMSTNGAAHA